MEIERFRSAWNISRGMFMASLSAMVLALLVGFSAPQGGPPVSDAVVGGQLTYTVKKNDSLSSVGARFGIDVRTLAELNGLKPSARLKEGQELNIDNRHIVLRALEDGIIINIPQRMLFYFESGKLVAAYPVGLGRRDWPTMTGDFEVLEKEIDKTWIVPKSIQEEMAAEGKPVKTRVPPGPSNPLGKYWIRISPSCGIHGTNAPASVYKFQTHGCIRLSPEDIADLFVGVTVGTPVAIVYEPILLARLPDGKVYLEVHPDVYGKAGDPLETVKRLASAADVESMIDWQEVREIVGAKRGLAQEVSLSPKNNLQGNP